MWHTFSRHPTPAVCLDVIHVSLSHERTLRKDVLWYYILSLGYNQKKISILPYTAGFLRPENSQVYWLSVCLQHQIFQRICSAPVTVWHTVNFLSMIPSLRSGIFCCTTLDVSWRELPCYGHEVFFRLVASSPGSKSNRTLYCPSKLRRKTKSSRCTG